MTSNLPQILPLTIFQAVGESMLWLAGTSLCKNPCRDESYLNAGFLHNWERNMSLTSPVFGISQKRSTSSHTKAETKEQHNSNFQVLIHLMFPSEHYIDWV